ncbi:RNA-binding motif protein, X-linked 2-like [Sorex fumeus]|uniref:RNA-binding motif protein, X-linked 2-like n=1 Tax=Sorex fumeus TaxID=62283 RepID=UPI0024ADBBFE|nr:RNA-binding motif protein, X-linked 2-like [Sorex fumeus]
MRSSPYVPTCLISSGLNYLFRGSSSPMGLRAEAGRPLNGFSQRSLHPHLGAKPVEDELGALGRRAVSLLGGNFCSPLTKLKLINDLKERGDQLGVAEKVSWHTEYKDSSSWIFLGELCRPVTSGDMICVFSRYGEIVNISLVHNKKTGKSKGFCFLCYEDHRSTILAVDNFNGIKIKGRTIRMDHVSNYRAPKDSDELDDVTRLLQEKGCGAHKPPKFSDEDSEDDKPTKKRKKGKTKRKKVNEEKREVQHDAPVSSSSPRSKMLKENNSPDCKKFNNKNSKKLQKSEFREGLKQGRSRDREPKKKKPKQEHRSLSRREEREEKNRDRDRDQRYETSLGLIQVNINVNHHNLHLFVEGAVSEVSTFLTLVSLKLQAKDPLRI